MLTATVDIHFVNFVCVCVLTANIYHQFNIVRVDEKCRNCKMSTKVLRSGGAEMEKRKRNLETAKIKSKRKTNDRNRHWAWYHIQQLQKKRERKRKMNQTAHQGNLKWKKNYLSHFCHFTSMFRGMYAEYFNFSFVLSLRWLVVFGWKRCGGDDLFA